MDQSRFDPPPSATRFQPTSGAPAPAALPSETEFVLTYGAFHKFGMSFILCCGMIAFSAMGVVILKKDYTDAGSWLGAGVLILVGVGLFGGMILNLFRARLEKTATTLKMRNALGTKFVLISDLRSFRLLPKNFVEFYPKPETQAKVFRVSRGLKDIDKLLAWAGKELVDEDRVQGEVEDKEALAALSALEPGAITDEQKLKTYSKIKKQFKALTFAIYGVLLWGWILPDIEYYWLITLLILCPAAIFGFMAMNKGVVRLDGAQKTGAPKAAAPLLGAFVVLGFRAASDFSLLDHSLILIDSVAIAVVMGSLIFALAPEARKKMGALAIYTLVAVAFGYGVSVEANCLLDQAKPQSFRVSVLSKRATGGRHPSYKLTVSGWGPKEIPDEISVDRDFYDASPVGSSLVISLYPGKLGAEWFVYSKMAGL